MRLAAIALLAIIAISGVGGVAFLGWRLLVKLIGGDLPESGSS